MWRWELFPKSWEEGFYCEGKEERGRGEKSEGVNRRRGEWRRGEEEKSEGEKRRMGEGERGRRGEREKGREGEREKGRMRDWEIENDVLQNRFP